MSLSSEPVNSDLTASHDTQAVKVAEGVPSYSDALKTEPSTTPPSSPPIRPKEMASQSQEMPPPAAPASKTRKRSRGEAADVAVDVPDSSANSAADFDPFASQDKEQSTTTDAAASIMQNQRLVRSSQQAPTSAQRANAGQSQRLTAQLNKSSRSAAPPKQVQQASRSDESEAGSDMTTASNDPGLPEDPIEDYDWREIENRYHDRMTEQHDREQKIFEDFGKLVAFFEVWAEVGGRKETDRGFKRLKTQMAYVQHEEDELEAKRLHYIRVVDAFKTVGVMLKEPNWAQSFIPDHKSLSKVRRSIWRQAPPGNTVASIRSEKRKRDHRITPLIKAEEWAVRVVGDVDMQRFSCRDPHVARCVIL